MYLAIALWLIVCSICAPIVGKFVYLVYMMARGRFALWSTAVRQLDSGETFLVVNTSWLHFGRAWISRDWSTVHEGYCHDLTQATLTIPPLTLRTVEGFVAHLPNCTVTRLAGGATTHAPPSPFCEACSEDEEG